MFKMIKKLTAEDATNLPEIMIYFYINSLGDFLWVQKRAKIRGEMAAGDGVVDEENAYHDQQKLVEILKAREGFQFKDHAEYMQWFCWWSNWHKRELTDDQWRALNRLCSEWKTEADFAGWRPSGDWREAAA